ncbi:UDP-N-acetylmuramoyl-L-alanine--D-glutamate ligase [Arenibacter certesii]|uniref:UDP-N-acetylmuramoylalanine--D-glutamate ligase n=1 Tax=Arenibacter certesii TaxID=228955 RepID=A0A918IXT2_9FLAO|nr:UDP-N-acetylmuramoyl-L-alanine--D-glutamate ligase [Arenibacter certesii]GGW37370.1 UDP-N-acetylmuramoylalanine--D-glutamate ligase [Arenibacter certesii]
MKRLVILGGGESGVGSAVLGKKEGFDVFVSDKGGIKEKYKNVLEHFEIDWEEKQHTESKILNADLVMKSPGVPETVPMVIAIRAAGITVVSEIEFASRYSNAKIIGITGSNGKTTTTLLTNYIIKESGLQVGMAGNVGDSYAKMVAENNFDHYVLEISSFQLDDIFQFRPHIAIITNITPDHLDRYEYKFENYIASKFRIAQNQTEEDYLIYDADDEVIVEWLKKNPVRSKLVPFSLEKKLEEGAYIENEKIIMKIDNNTIEMSTESLALEGKHNVKNTMAATSAATLIGIRKESIRRSIETFQGVEHRLEKVLKIHYVQYINDSKATNVNATYYALDSMKSPTVWIVGGVDKGNDYKQLMSLVREKVKAIICLGEDNSKIKDAFGNVVDLMVETNNMEEAVKMAYKIAERGDTVLLSPACASFDLFENYEDRGNQFKAAIKKL